MVPVAMETKTTGSITHLGSLWYNGYILQIWTNSIDAC